MNVKRKKQTYHQKNKLPLHLLFLSAVCIVLLAAVIFSGIISANREPVVEFIPPEFAADAAVGMPSVPTELGYAQIYKEGLGFSAWLCGNVRQEEGSVVVYFTNPESNTAWMKLRVFDETGNILGESGLLRPGEYVRSVELVKTVSAGTVLKMKIMTYEPETYYSLGAVTVGTMVTE